MRWMVEATEFGCGVCADEQNRLYGHVSQVGTHASRSALLLRCPRGAHYEHDTVRDTFVRLTEAGARAEFPESDT